MFQLFISISMRGGGIHVLHAVEKKYSDNNALFEFSPSFFKHFIKNIK